MNKYLWRATMADGSILDQYDSAGVEVSSAHIDANSVVKMELIPQDSTRQPIIVHIDVDKGERFIRFWRNFKVYNSGESNTTNWVVGIQKTIQGENMKFLVYSKSDGVIEISTDDEL